MQESHFEQEHIATTKCNQGSYTRVGQIPREKLYEQQHRYDEADKVLVKPCLFLSGIQAHSVSGHRFSPPREPP
jgi:hypothetical protein